MCFDGCSSSLSPTHFEKLQPQPIIYLLGRFHVSKMFSHKCTYCAPVSQLFMLRLCHSSMSLHPLSLKRKEWGGRERGEGRESDRRDRPVEWHFVWESRLLCARGDNTSHCHYTGWQSGKHARMLDQNSRRYTQTHACTHTRAISFVWILMSVLKNTVPWMFSAQHFHGLCFIGCKAGRFGSSAGLYVQTQTMQSKHIIVNPLMVFKQNHCLLNVSCLFPSIYARAKTKVQPCTGGKSQICTCTHTQT